MISLLLQLKTNIIRTHKYIDKALEPTLYTYIYVCVLVFIKVFLLEFIRDSMTTKKKKNSPSVMEMSREIEINLKLLG
jgi:hypothetical protein